MDFRSGKTVNVMLLVNLLGFWMVIGCSEDKIQPGNETVHRYDQALCDSVNVTYSGMIKPLFATRCNTSGCHQSGFSAGDFTTYEKLLPYVENGLIHERSVDDRDMPPVGVGTLSADELLKLDCWLHEGGPNN